MRTMATLGVLLHFTLVSAQDTPLFKSQEPLNVRATGSIKSIKKNTNDSTFNTGKFEFENGGTWTTVQVESRGRGNWRLRNCHFPPLKINFRKKNVAGTVFEGNKSLKVVLPCLNTSDKNTLIRKEYLVYRLYSLLSPYYFNTRLATLHLTEISRKKPREYDLVTFFVEDNSLVARRMNAKVTKKKGIPPVLFEATQSVRNDFFQYMIGNADFSSVYQHNSNTLIAGNKYIPLSYDFDMSGLVNAGYAKANAPKLGTGDPRERVYRGFCRPQDIMEGIRKEYLEKEAGVHAIIDSQAENLPAYEVKDMHSYVDEFYVILKNDAAFQSAIVGQCRTK
jgi:hypothetical protein